MPELRESEQVAELIIAAGYNNLEELMDTSTSERGQLYRALSGGRPGWGRLLRKMLDAKAAPTAVEVKKALPFKEVDIFAAPRQIRCPAGSESY